VTHLIGGTEPVWTLSGREHLMAIHLIIMSISGKQESHINWQLETAFRLDR
jgi:hypothetical protein